MSSGLGERFRTAFLTGASAGLGEAFARMLLAEGVQVWGTARSRSRLDVFSGAPGFHPVVFDLHDAAATTAEFERANAGAGGFDLVINNAGYGLFAPFTDRAFAEWEQQIAAMLVQPMRIAHAAMQAFRVRGSGTLVNVASLAVEFPLPYMSGYNVVKAGLAALSESLLLETAGTRIAIVDFRPGDYRTEFNRAMPSGSEAAAGRDLATAELRRAWDVLERNLAAAPLPQRAARDLRHALRRGQRGTVRSGSFFQARVAPTFAGLLPEPLRRQVRWRYFGL